MRELRGALVSMYSDLEESRAGENRAVAVKDEEIGRPRDDLGPID